MENHGKRRKLKTLADVRGNTIFLWFMEREGKLLTEKGGTNCVKKGEDFRKSLFQFPLLL